MIIGCSIGILHIKEHFETVMGSRTVNATMYGEISSSTAFVAYTVDIVTQNVFVELAPVTSLTSGSGSCFTESADGRLQYTCATTAQFHCATTISYSTVSANNDDVRIRLGDNGTTLIESEATDRLATVDTKDSTALHAMITLAQNEYVSVWMANGTDTDDFSLLSLNIFCMEAL